MTDKQLVQRTLLHADHRAFEELMKRHSFLVYGKALSILHQSEQAKEVAQQTWVKVYYRLSSWRGDQFAPWVSAIATFTALNERERSARQRSFEEHPSRVLVAADEYDSEREERLQQMEKAIRSLQPQDREIIRLHYYQHMKTDEVARLLNLSQSNVLVRLHRIRERLKNELSQIRQE